MPAGVDESLILIIIIVISSVTSTVKAKVAINATRPLTKRFIPNTVNLALSVRMHVTRTYPSYTAVEKIKTDNTETKVAS